MGRIKYVLEATYVLQEHMNVLFTAKRNRIKLNLRRLYSVSRQECLYILVFLLEKHVSTIVKQTGTIKSVLYMLFYQDGSRLAI